MPTAPRRRRRLPTSLLSTHPDTRSVLPAPARTRAGGRARRAGQ
jgi:hypothetical protein